MPLYDYECEQCHRHTEKIQKFSDAPLTECPYCGGHLERVLHAPAVAFKGGGWYADGYGSKKPAASGDNKTESKVETKSSESKRDAGTRTAESSSTPAPSAPAASTAAASPSGSDKK